MGGAGAERSGSPGIIGDLSAWFAFLLAAVALGSRFAPVVNHTVLVLAALSPYLSIVGAGVSVALLLRGGRRRLAAAVGLVLIVAVGVQAPRFFGSGRHAGHGVAVRVVTANLQEGSADPQALSEVARSDADLLIVQELTPECAAGLEQLAADFPHRAVDARPGAGGVGIWSRYPLTGSLRLPGYELGVLSARVRTPGAAEDTVVLAAHLVGPWPQPIDGWRREIAALPDTLRLMARTAGGGAVIVAGDFNATPDMLPFRRLTDDGYRDAAREAGAGLNPTYPADSWSPPLIAIDHILLRNSSATDVRTVRVPGSDHLGVAATVHLPG